MATATLCSLEEVKNFLGQKGAVAEDDDLIESLCERITSIFSNWCGISSFTPATYTEYHNGNGTQYIFPNNIPITSITSIYLDDDWVFGSDTMFPNSLSYKVVDNRYIVMRDDILTTGEQNVKIIYTAGYSTIPEDLKQAAIEEVSRKFRRRKEIDLASKSVEGGTVNFVKDELLKSTKDILLKYKRMDVI
jgi:hypothetical protein